MKLYPEATKKFLNEAGRYKTKDSRRTVNETMRTLQNVKPGFTVGRFTATDLQQFILGQTGATKPLAPASQRVRLTVVRSVFDWLEFAEHIKTNPAHKLKFMVNIRSRGVHNHHWMSADELVKIVQAQPDTLYGRRGRIILMLGVLCGLRRTEICDVRWSHFSRDLSELRVLGKGGKLETVGVPDELRTELIEWRKFCPGDVVVFKTTPQGDVVDKPVVPNTLYGLIVEMAGQSKIPFRPHDLRRSFANLLEDSTVPLPDISRAMRHSNVGTTSAYLEKNTNRTVKVTSNLRLGLK